MGYDYDDDIVVDAFGSAFVQTLIEKIFKLQDEVDAFRRKAEDEARGAYEAAALVDIYNLKARIRELEEG